MPTFHGERQWRLPTADFVQRCKRADGTKPPTPTRLRRHDRSCPAIEHRLRRFHCSDCGEPPGLSTNRQAASAFGAIEPGGNSRAQFRWRPNAASDLRRM
jgi:hypothetical protein